MTRGNTDIEVINDAYEEKDAEGSFKDGEVRAELKKRLDAIEFLCVTYRPPFPLTFARLFAAAFFPLAVQIALIVERARFDLFAVVFAISFITYVPFVLLAFRAVFPKKRYFYKNVIFEKTRGEWLQHKKNKSYKIENGKTAPIKYNGLTRSLDHFFTGIFCEKIFKKTNGDKVTFYNDDDADLIKNTPRKKEKFIFRLLDFIYNIFSGGDNKRHTMSGYTAYDIIFRADKPVKCVFNDGRYEKLSKRRVMKFTRYNENPADFIPDFALF